jgi:hypothetical protein
MFFCLWGKSRCEDLIFCPNVSWDLIIAEIVAIIHSVSLSLSLSAITITQSAANVFHLSVK